MEPPRTWSDAEALIGVASESETLDLKRDLSKQGHDFAKDIAAMAKRGGTILYGVDEDKSTRVAAAITPVPIDGAEERIRNATRSVDPRLDFKVDVLKPTPAAHDGVVVVEVPPSPEWPHMVSSRYPVRDGTTTRYLTHTEVRAVLRGADEPLLSLAATSADGTLTTRLDERASLRPWPIDVKRIVENELADAEQSVALHPGALDVFASSVDQLLTRPTQADHTRAKQEFRDGLPTYAEALTAWLEEYVAASHAWSTTFVLDLVLANAQGAGHADDAVVVVELPSGAEAVDELPTMSLPPEPPRYHPPRSRSRSRFDAPSWPASTGSFGIDRLRDLADLNMAGLDFSAGPRWRERAGGRALELTVGPIHAGRHVSLDDSLLLRVNGAGEHTIHWTVYSKSLREPARGALVLVVPIAPARPAFGRLAAITRYPDVPLVDEAGEVVYDLRSTEPEQRRPSAPARPDEAAESASAESALRRLRDRHEGLHWDALGLDPSGDGPLDKTAPEDIRPARRQTSD